MNFGDFKGAAKPVEPVDVAILAHRLAVPEDKMRAIWEVEARSSGFDLQGRPKALFEPHVFYRNLSGAKRQAAVEAGLAYPKWGQKKYPRDSYDRIHQAMEIDQTAALKAASWGSGQILGENHVAAGYETPQDMVWSFMEDEDNHVEAMVAFILANSLDDEIRRGDWTGFARGYNGPGYRRNGYHTKLAAAYRKWQAIPDVDWEPDGDQTAGPGLPNGDPMKRVQGQLRDLGYFEVGSPDGKWGYKTRAAVLAFRVDNDLPLAPSIDQQFLAEIAKASPRPISQERAMATVDDLRESGSRTVHEADDASALGKVLAGGGGVVGAVEVLDAVTDRTGAVSGAVDVIQPALDFFYANMPLILIAAGAYIIWKMYRTNKLRLEDHRAGKHVGR